MEKLFRLIQQENHNEIETYLKTLSTKEACKLFDECCLECEEGNFPSERKRRESEVLPIAVKCLFQGLNTSNENTLRREFVFEHVLLYVLEKDLPPKISSEIIGLLLFQVDSLSGTGLAKIASKILDGFKSEFVTNGRPLELFPKILTSISKKDVVVFEGSEMSGIECKNHFFNILCDTKWKSRNIIHLTSVLRDLVMTPEECHAAIEKLIQMIKELSLDDVPPFVYQLLLLSLKGQKRAVLEGIISFFDQKETVIIKTITMVPETVEDDDDETCAGPTEDRLHHIEGTVIFHILCAMRRDHELAKEFIKFLKDSQQNPSLVLNSFTIALGLSTANIRCFQDQIFSCFKIAISQYFKEKELKKCSQWFEDLINFDYDVSGIFMEVIRNSARGWDPVMEGLVEIGFILLDSNAAKPGKKPVVTGPVNPTPPIHESPISALGMDVLFDTFKLCSAVRGTILERLLNLIITKKNCTNYHTELLTMMIKSFPLYIMENTTKIQQRLEFLHLLPLPNAVGLIRALCFFLKYSIGLKDSLMITLRKAAFSSNLETRKVAAAGYLLLLKHFKILGVLPSSQTSQSTLGSQIFIDVHSKFNPETNEAICLDLLGTLRRCLTQQLEIRCMIYEGLCKILCTNRNLQEPILELLHHQFFKYFEEKEHVNPPVKMDSLFSTQNDEMILHEPLAHLVHCIQFCIRKMTQTLDQQTNAEASTSQSFSASKRLFSVLNSLRRRMITADLEDFELDKSADFTSTTTAGQKKLLQAKLILGLYESLMEFTCFAGESREERIETLQSLFHNHQKLTAMLREKGNVKKKEKNKSSSTTVSTGSLLSMEALAEAMKMILANDEEPDQEVLKDGEFNYYIMSTTANSIQAIKDNGRSSAPETDSFEKLFVPFSTIAKFLLQCYCEKRKTTKTENLQRLCLEAFANVVTTICSSFPNKLHEFITNLESLPASAEQDKEENETIRPLVQFLEKEVGVMIDKSSEDLSKEIGIVINIMNTLFPWITTSEYILEQCLKWTQKLCVEQSFENTILIRTILNFHFRLIAVSKKSKKTLYRDIAHDCHSKLGDIDQDIVVEGNDHFAIVTAASASTVSILLIQQLGNLLNHVNWILSLMKGQLNRQPLNDQETNNRIFKENKVCSCLGMILTVLHELVQTSFPPNHSVQHLIKLLITFFNTLMLFCKYFIAVYTFKAGHLCLRFEKLINMCGTHLTPQVYSLITHYETSNQGDTRRKLTCVAEKAKIIRETKYIPNLIYEIEQYERFLMRLTKKSHVNLMTNVKLSTSRDFRINMEVVQRAIENQSSDDENKEPQNARDVEEQEPSSKRAKRHSKNLSRSPRNESINS